MVYIVPFIYNRAVCNYDIEKQSVLNYTIHCINILCMDGKEPWYEMGEHRWQDIKNDILESNDIYAKDWYFSEDGTAFVEVDTNRTNIQSMYKWSEVEYNNSDMLSWRSFYFLYGAKGLHWLDTAVPSKLDVILRNILKTAGVE